MRGLRLRPDVWGEDGEDREDQRERRVGVGELGERQEMEGPMKTWRVHWWGERRGSCLVTAESLDGGEQ